MMRPTRIVVALALAAVAALAAPVPATAQDRALVEPPMLAERVAKGELPPVGQRVPEPPSVVTFEGARSLGRHGGDLNMLIGSARDVRLLVVYGYARLVAYDEHLELKPDLLESVDVEEGRVFTLRLRKGHRWSDGAPFTAEDFRYWWEDIANNRNLMPAGPPVQLLVDGQPPQFEVLDETTVRYTWHDKNPHFLPQLAGAAPLFIYRPSHYLKQFHIGYASKEDLTEKLGNYRNWAAMHNRLDNLYRFDNPDLPTLQPWMNTTRPPANRFIAERNPYYHRVDAKGLQLPYIDRVILTQAASQLIPAKAGAGEVDLQARGLFFNNYPFLRESEKRNEFRTYLWREGKASHVALFPNLNIDDPGWRELMRDVRFRRALSLGIDRELINQALYYGLAIPGNNTVLPESPLFDEERQTRWAVYDPEQANELLDQLGLTERRGGVRLLPDGRKLEIVVETAGEEPEQVDVLELVKSNWQELGIELFIKPSQREVLRNRIFAGDTQMAVWTGFENGLPTADFSPAELAPTMQHSYQWPKWGQHYETKGQLGEAVDMPAAQELFDLYQQWLDAESREQRAEIWHRMLEIHADQVFTIGIVSGVMQPVVVSKDLRNVPEEGLYNWDPGAQFGIYRPDTFWFDTAG